MRLLSLFTLLLVISSVAGLSSRDYHTSDLYFQDYLQNSENNVGRLNLQLRFDRYFITTYGYGEYSGENSSLKTYQNSRFTGIESDSPVWFPDINSNEYEVGYGMDDISVGEQLLYGLGFILLQMTAGELDESINR